MAQTTLQQPNSTPKLINSWYEDWLPKKINFMRRTYKGYLEAWSSNRCEVIRLEELCLNTGPTFERMFNHAGIEPSLSYLHLKDKRYANTSGTTIEPTLCTSFIKTLPAHIEERILSDFTEFDRWFYNFGPLRQE
jgi:hypothetical protein